VRSGEYVRPSSHSGLCRTGEESYQPAVRRYNLSSDSAAPGHRTVVVLALKGLEDVSISVHHVLPSPVERRLGTQPRGGEAAALCMSWQNLATVDALQFQCCGTNRRRPSSTMRAEIIIDAELRCPSSQAIHAGSLPRATERRIDRWNKDLSLSQQRRIAAAFAQTQRAYDEACNQLIRNSWMRLTQR